MMDYANILTIFEPSQMFLIDPQAVSVTSCDFT